MLVFPALLLPKNTVSGARRTAPVSRQALKFLIDSSLSIVFSLGPFTRRFSAYQSCRIAAQDKRFGSVSGLQTAGCAALSLPLERAGLPPALTSPSYNPARADLVSAHRRRLPPGLQGPPQTPTRFTYRRRVRIRRYRRVLACRAGVYCSRHSRSL